MIAPLILLLIALGGIGAALVVPGWADVILIAASMAVASLFLLVQAWWRARAAIKKWIVVDGSNVMHWQDNVPQIAVLREVLEALAKRGFTPVVVFDANAGHKLNKGYQHDGALGRMLGLPENRVMVVDKGTPADPSLLTLARDLKARVVSNDRFRDWQKEFPEVTAKGHLIRGAYRGKDLWLDLD